MPDSFTPDQRKNGVQFECTIPLICTGMVGVKIFHIWAFMLSLCVK